MGDIYISHMVIIIYKGECMDKENETLEKIYDNKIRKIKESKIFENKSFDEAIKPYLKKFFTDFAQICISINLTYDVIFDLKHNSEYYKKYSKAEKIKINRLLIIFENFITGINKALDEIILCINIK